MYDRLQSWTMDDAIGRSNPQDLSRAQTFAARRTEITDANRGYLPRGSLSSNSE